MLFLTIFLSWYFIGLCSYLSNEYEPGYFTKGNVLVLILISFLGAIVPVVFYLQGKEFSWWDEPLFKDKTEE